MDDIPKPFKFYWTTDELRKLFNNKNSTSLFNLCAWLKLDLLLGFSSPVFSPYLSLNIIIFVYHLLFSGHIFPTPYNFLISGKLPHKHKIVIAGNHDLGFEDGEDEKRRGNAYRGRGTTRGYELLTNCTYLQDSGVEVGNRTCERGKRRNRRNSVQFESCVFPAEILKFVV